MTYLFGPKRQCAKTKHGGSARLILDVDSTMDLKQQCQRHRCGRPVSISSQTSQWLFAISHRAPVRFSSTYVSSGQAPSSRVVRLPQNARTFLANTVSIRAMAEDQNRQQKTANERAQPLADPGGIRGNCSPPPSRTV